MPAGCHPPHLKHSCTSRGRSHNIIQTDTLILFTFSQPSFYYICISWPHTIKNFVARVYEWTIPIERPPLVDEVSANILRRECAMWSAWHLYGRILGFLDRSRYFFFQVAPQLYSRGWVDPVPDPLLLRKSSSAGTRIWNSGSVARNSDH
jgi:hypothetical protein